jgi:hypothetical protein
MKFSPSAITVMPSVAGRNELQDLVDDPNETLDFEYKSWLDLGDSAARADLARHIAALANHGGGAIVFAFTDATPPQFAGPNPYPKVVCDRDTVAGIVKKYLEPTFQCDVLMIRSAVGNEHPVIVVPAHGAVPICSKASGPEVSGKPSGITQGTYYTRKPGPESAPITSSVDWAPIIRRCAMHDRASVLSAINAALIGSGSGGSSIEETLNQFHEATHTAFLKDAQRKTTLPELAKWHYQLSYAIDRADRQELDLNYLPNALRQVNSEVRDLVRTGWSMMHVFDRPDIAPYFNSDAATGQGDKEFLECALLRDPEPRVNAADMWRVTPSGMTTLIRTYWEDDLELNAANRRKPGTWFSPNMLALSLAEFIRHARGYAERFESPTTVSFRCEWRGLEGRHVDDPFGPWSRHPPASTGHRIKSGTWPVTTLTSDWPGIVANLGAPVARMFDVGNVFTSQWITGECPKWLRI